MNKFIEYYKTSIRKNKTNKTSDKITKRNLIY